MPSPKPSYTEILQSYQNLVAVQFPTADFSEGTVFGMFANLHAQEMSSVYDKLTASENARDINTATGQDLDNLARSLGGLTRLSPVRAGSDATAAQLLITNTSGVSLSLAAGTLVWSVLNPQIRFAVTKTTIIAAGVSGTAYLQASQTGVGYNVGTGQLTSHNGDSRLQVTNILPIRGGSSIESDDEFRFRIVQTLQAAVGGGQSSAVGIRNTLLGLPGVVDALLINLAHGPGTLDVIVVPQAGYLPDDDFLTSATEALASVAAVGVEVKVRAPTTVPVTTQVSINLRSSASNLSLGSGLKSQIVQIVEAYINTRNVYLPQTTPGSDSTSIEDTVIDYSVLLSQITNAAIAFYGSSLQNVLLSFGIGNSFDSAISGDVYARAGEVLRSRAVQVSFSQL